MEERIAVITGGSSEIGGAIIQKLLGYGIKIFAQHNTNKIKIKDKNLFSFQCSFEDTMGVEEFVNQILASKLSVGYLINSAGFIENDSFLNVDSLAIQRVFNINLFSHVHLMQKVFPMMCENKFGRIVTLSSIGVKFSGSKNSVYYSASKASLEAVTRSFAKFGAEYNVLCNNIRVGVVETKIHQNRNLSERKDKIPLKKFGTTGDIAEMVAYLCSDKANFITGQEIAISGGE